MSESRWAKRQSIQKPRPEHGGGDSDWRLRRRLLIAHWTKQTLSNGSDPGCLGRPVGRSGRRRSPANFTSAERMNPTLPGCKYKASMGFLPHTDWRPRFAGIADFDVYSVTLRRKRRTNKAKKLFLSASSTGHDLPSQSEGARSLLLPPEPCTMGGRNAVF